MLHFVTFDDLERASREISESTRRQTLDRSARRDGKNVFLSHCKRPVIPS